MPTMNRRITLAGRPVGMPKESDFRLEESPMPLPGGGEVLVQARYLSVDPYMRGRLTGVASYARGLDLGEVIVGGVVGRVLESGDPRCSAGDTVEGMLGWQEYAVAPGKSLRKIDPAAGPISSALYVLGMPGLTAYFGLQELCPNGVDVYFDNVGGAITDAVMRRIAKHARVAVCGQISQYNSVEPQTGPRWLSQLVVRQVKVEGFLVSQFAGRFEAGLKQLATWLKEKRLLYREDVVNGLENAPHAFIRMLEGKNIGKQLVKVSE